MLRVKASVQQWLIPKNHHFMQVVHCSHTPKVNKLSLPETIHKRVRIDPIASTFDPVQVEKGWQEWWKDVVVTEKSNSTNADKKQKFTMILPPPNITGALHIGHALTITIQDALARWHRMRGFDVEWIPGLDHAGIATQSVVERKLMKESNLTRHDLGRDEFIKEVWKWNHQYGGRILEQIDRLGASINKDSLYFTLDDTRSEAVIDAFVRLHERGLVYRRRRMVNWCPSLRTAISDIEVEVEQLEGTTKKILPGYEKPVEFGVMHRILYKIEGLDEFLEVDTTRPETIFGDVAVAVHPCDERYHRFHGKHVIHPLTGEPLPIVLDDKLVNMELGTGVVKITPAHDPKDFECGQRHNLPEKEVIDLDGKMCGDIHPSFHGLDRFEAREKILEEVETRGLYVGKTDHPTALQLCSRSGTVIEPLLMPQWFVDCGKMGSRAASNVRECEITIEPAQHTHTWFRFLDNIQDWCVSRQIWWGHRIPAYKIKGYDDEWVVGRSIDDALEKAQAKFNRKFQPSDLKQDEDVLDTWFSSALLPLSATSWSEKSSGEIPTQSKGTYPLTVMETGYDILFFWVARMAMLCEELSGKVPFEKVLLHPMVRDKAGRKMSKSLGNVIDPLHVIDGVSYDDLLLGLQKGNVGVRELAKAEKELKREFPKGIPTCGADALRFTMASYLQQGRQINMDVQRVVSYRHFCNKIWNAVRYAIPLLGTSAKFERGDLLQGKTKMSLADRWILSKMANAVIACNSGLQSNHLANSVAALQKFFVQELCDVYIELSKPVLYGNRIRVHENTPQEELDARQQSAQAVLHFCLDYSMRLLHPFIPFVTEELWQRIRVSGPASDALQTDSILTARFPEESDVSIWIDDVAESEMKLVLDVIHSIRSLKQIQKKLAPNANEKSELDIVCSDVEIFNQIHRSLPDIEGQARVADINLVHTESSSDNGPILTQSISERCRVHLILPNDKDTSERVRAEMKRLEKRAIKSRNTLQGLIQRQQDPSYKKKVPEEVQAVDEARQIQLETDLAATMKTLDALQQLGKHYE